MVSCCHSTEHRRGTELAGSNRKVSVNYRNEWACVDKLEISLTPTMAVSSKGTSSRVSRGDTQLTQIGHIQAWRAKHHSMAEILPHSKALSLVLFLFP